MDLPCNQVLFSQFPEVSFGQFLSLRVSLEIKSSDLMRVFYRAFQGPYSSEHSILTTGPLNDRHVSTEYRLFHSILTTGPLNDRHVSTEYGLFQIVSTDDANSRCICITVDGTDVNILASECLVVVELMMKHLEVLWGSFHLLVMFLWPLPRKI